MQQAIDTSAIKLLTSETAIIQHRTMAQVQYYNRAGFDRMHRSASNLVARKANVCKTVVQAGSMTKEAMIHSLKTGLGVSDDTYQHCNA